MASERRLIAGYRYYGNLTYLFVVLVIGREFLRIEGGVSTPRIRGELARSVVDR